MLDPTPYRELFPIAKRLAVFNHAGVSPLNTRAVAAMNAFNEQCLMFSLNEFRDETTTTLDGVT